MQNMQITHKYDLRFCIIKSLFSRWSSDLHHLT